MVKHRKAELTLPDGNYNIPAVLKKLQHNRTAEEKIILEKALDFAKTEGQDILTPLGVSCFVQSINMALLLENLGLDTDALAAALCFPAFYYGKLSKTKITQAFSPTIINLIESVAKMMTVHADSDIQQVEGLRRLLMAVVEDIRSVLIKLAEHTSDMREAVRSSDQALRLRYAKESEDLYAPLANRLGIGQIKWELEDLSFRIKEPIIYKEIAKFLDQRRAVRELYIEQLVANIKQALSEQNIENKVYGRAKHIFSIWKKMQRKGVSYHEIYDIHGVRIIVQNVRDCYGALGIVHGLWQHIPKEFDDYIANPKENGYQSLHTAVIGPEGKTIEVQIRTEEMNRQAELGVAAHWRYKEGGKADVHFETKLNNLRQVLAWEQEWTKDSVAVEALHREIFQDRVYVLTPKGKVIDLPQSATVLDFAYHIHTDIGNRCRGAKVNGRLVSLHHVLKSGDQIEIITAKQGGPSRDWLNPELGYLTTVRARAKAHQWFKRQDRDQNIIDGREQLERELKRLSVDHLSFEALANKLKFNKTDDFLAAIGAGDIKINQMLNAIQALVGPLLTKKEAPKKKHPPSVVQEKRRGPDVVVAGIGNLMSQMARCCKPVPGDEIIGYITLGRGVTIHRKDCPNILQAKARAQPRLIQVEWGEKIAKLYLADIKIVAHDRHLLLRDISAILAFEKANVINIKMDRNSIDNIVEFYITLEVSSIEVLTKTLMKILDLPNVVEAKRIGTK